MDQIDRAMRAAFFNPDRAVEYLLNGIPESREQEMRAPAAGRGGAESTQVEPGQTEAAAPVGSDEPVNLFEQAAAAGRGGAGGNRGAGDLGAALGGGAGGATGARALDFLRTNPQFQQLRQVVQQQPQMLEPILQQVAAGNPQLAQAITQNQEQFMQLLAEDVDDDAALPSGAQQISVTEEEREAIERVRLIMFQDKSSSYTDLDSSCVVWAFRETTPFRLTSRATRTRSWQRTSCLISQMSPRRAHRLVILSRRESTRESAR